MAPFRRRGKREAHTVTLPSATTARHSRRLLVCDDNASVTDLLGLMFATEGWALEVVADGPACLDALARNQPDVLLLDQRLEGPLSGIETADAARRRGFDLPILLFSAYLDDDALRDAQRLRLMPVSKLDFPAIVRHVNAAYELTTARS